MVAHCAHIAPASVSNYNESVKKFKYQLPGYKKKYKTTKFLCDKLRDIVRLRQVNIRRPSSDIEEFVGIDLKGLLKHLEDKFYGNPKTGEAMAWSNHDRDGWHIDHIKPCSAFDLKNKDHVKECFHYTNLQPMWAEENLRKGGINKKKKIPPRT